MCKATFYALIKNCYYQFYYLIDSAAHTASTIECRPQQNKSWLCCFVFVFVLQESEGDGTPPASVSQLISSSDSGAPHGTSSSQASQPSEVTGAVRFVLRRTVSLERKGYRWPIPTGSQSRRTIVHLSTVSPHTPWETIAHMVTTLSHLLVGDELMKSTQYLWFCWMAEDLPEPLPMLLVTSHLYDLQ